MSGPMLLSLSQRLHRSHLLKLMIHMVESVVVVGLVAVVAALSVEEVCVVVVEVGVSVQVLAASVKVAVAVAVQGLVEVVVKVHKLEEVVMAAATVINRPRPLAISPDGQVPPL